MACLVLDTRLPTSGTRLPKAWTPLFCSGEEVFLLFGGQSTELGFHLHIHDLLQPFRQGPAKRFFVEVCLAIQAAALKASDEGAMLPKTSTGATRPILRSNLSPPDSGRLRWFLRFDPPDPLAPRNREDQKRGRVNSVTKVSSEMVRDSFSPNPTVES